MADSKDMLKVIIDALQDKKAEDIRVIDEEGKLLISAMYLLLQIISLLQVVAILTRFRLW